MVKYDQYNIVIAITRLSNIIIVYSRVIIYKPISTQIEMSQFRMTASVYPSTYKSPLNLTGIQQNCSKYGIKLQKMGDIQLQAAYAMQGFKALGPKPNQLCFIFVSIIDQNSVSIASYLNGTLIQKKQLANQAQVPDFIKSSLQTAAQQPQKQNNGIEQQYKDIEKLFDNLNKQSEKVLKTCNNQMMAVQQIQSSQQYLAVCNHAKLLSLQVQQLLNTVKARQNKASIKNQSLIDQMLRVQTEKQNLQQDLYKYSQLVKQLSDVDSILAKIISQKKQHVKHQDFYDQQSFNLYLQESISIKKLENQKKYLNHV